MRFWHDLLCGEQPLKFSFLELFIIARCMDALVADHMQFWNGTFIGMFSLQDLCMIGRWKWSLISLSFILKE